METKWQLLLFRYFDIFSFCTEYQPTKGYSQFVQGIFAFHIISATLSTVSIVLYMNRPMLDDLGKANDMIKFVAGLLVYWTSIFEMHSNRPAQRRFWQRLNDIDRQCCSHRSLIRLRYLVKILFVLIIMLYIVCMHFRKVVVCGIDYLYFFYSYELILFIFLNRAFYYLFYVELIKCELEIIENELKLTKKMNSNAANQRLYRKLRTHRYFEYERFKWTRVYYRMICGISVHLNETFGWSNGLTILYAFQLTLTDANWFFWKWYNKGFSGHQYGSAIYHQRAPNFEFIRLCLIFLVFCTFSVFDYVIWLGMLSIVIYFIFDAPSRCSDLVSVIISH